MAGAWSMAGDECPACGSKNTVLRDFRQDVQVTPSIGGPSQVRGRNARYTMECQDCGHKEDKQGTPGQKP